MTSSQFTNLHVEQANLDELLFESQIFPQKITGILTREGIVTLRLLLMHTGELLCRDVKQIGPGRITEIENVLAIDGRHLAETADEKNVTLARLLAKIAFDKITRPVSLLELTQMINESRHSTNLHVIWDSDAVAVAAANHQFIKQVENGYYICVNVPSKDLLSTSKPEVLLKEGKILLSQLWTSWFTLLTEMEQITILYHYGIGRTVPLSIKAISVELNVTSGRISALRNTALRRLRRYNRHSKKQYLQIVHKLLADGIKQANNLLSSTEWENWVCENTIWEEREPVPSLLHLLCDLSDEFHYLEEYQIATVKAVTADHLERLGKIIKDNLRQHRKTGLTAEELTTEVQRQLSTDIPDDIRDPVFIFKAIDLFDKIEQGGDGRYFYKQQRPKTLYPPVNSGWAGKPGTRLYDWELKFRHQFEKVDWIGELRLSQDDFTDICLAIQEEAKAPHLFSKIVEGQPRLVPPAVFVTTMVFTARYAEKRHDEERYEFWHPYIRYVWGIEEYSQAFPKGPQAFQKRCQQRFNESVSFLEAEYNFKFPRTGKAQEDVITPIFRHALIPRYIQNAFAIWLRKNWRNIFAVADNPTLLASQLQADRSLELHSHRLKQFVTSEYTAETAAILITTMATAVSLHINHGESIESISYLLADSPIEQELWHEIAKEFVQPVDVEPIPRHFDTSQVMWVWVLNKAQLALYVPNIILSTTGELEGEPSSLAWIGEAAADSLTATITTEVTTWYTKSGECIIQDAFLEIPPQGIGGSLILLTELGQTIQKLNVPPYPENSIQFFQTNQNGAYGIPIDTSQVSDGVWLVCAEHPLTFLDEDGEIIEPDEELCVPSPLSDKYNWAARLTLILPVVVGQHDTEVMMLDYNVNQRRVGQPIIVGANLVEKSSPQIYPTFTDTQIHLKVSYGGKRLMKQSSLLIWGKDGWRWQGTLAEHALVTEDDVLHFDLSHLLPIQPNFYTLELRVGLRSIFSRPIQFSVVPEAIVEPAIDKYEEPLIQVLEPVRNELERPTQIRETVHDSIIKSRVGQGRFRYDLINYWRGCAITGCKKNEILVASHIKPWKVSSNTERLDVYNGLLLIPNLNSVFDQGLVSFSNEGTIIISSLLDEEARFILGIHPNMKIKKVEKSHHIYLEYHRENIFKYSYKR